MAYTTVTGGGIMLNAGTATITDSAMSKANGDFLVVNAGGGGGGGPTLNVSYSSLGLEAGGDTTHCNMHVSGGKLTFMHSNISSSSYGIMFYGGQNANFTYDNWFSNSTTNVDPTPGAVTGDFSNGWFDKNPPMAVTGITANNLSGTRLVACTGANDTVCAGARP
jgi:hypothetical protein